MTLNHDGNLGVGVTSPGYKVEVAGAVKAGTAGNSSANIRAIALVSAGTATTQAAIGFQQMTTEGDTFIFADYEPYAEYNFFHENSGVVRVDSFEENNPNLVISLDDLYFNEPVKFIKIDIEGHEYSAFEGMLKLIKRDKPMVWLEDNEQVAVPYLQSLGYNILEKNELTEDYLMI